MFSSMPRRGSSRRRKRPQRRFLGGWIDASPLDGLEARSLAAPSISGVISPFTLHIFMDGQDGNAVAHSVATAVNATPVSNAVVTASSQANGPDIFQAVVSAVAPVGPTGGGSASPLTLVTPYPGISVFDKWHESTNGGGNGSQLVQDPTANKTLGLLTKRVSWNSSGMGSGYADLKTQAILYAPDPVPSGVGILTLTDNSTDAPDPPYWPNGVFMQNDDFVLGTATRESSSYSSHHQTLQSGLGPSAGEYIPGTEPSVLWSYNGTSGYSTLTVSGRASVEYDPPPNNQALLMPIQEASVKCQEQSQLVLLDSTGQQIGTQNEWTTNMVSTNSNPYSNNLSVTWNTVSSGANVSNNTVLPQFSGGHQGSTGLAYGPIGNAGNSWSWSSVVDLKTPNLSTVEQSTQWSIELLTIDANGSTNGPGGQATTFRAVFQITNVSVS